MKVQEVQPDKAKFYYVDTISGKPRCITCTNFAQTHNDNIQIINNKALIMQEMQ